jgi:hypothetical protein
LQTQLIAILSDKVDPSLHFDPQPKRLTPGRGVGYN